MSRKVQNYHQLRNTLHSKAVHSLLHAPRTAQLTSLSVARKVRSGRSSGLVVVSSTERVAD